MPGSSSPGSTTRSSAFPERSGRTASPSTTSPTSGLSASPSTSSIRIRPTASMASMTLKATTPPASGSPRRPSIRTTTAFRMRSSSGRISWSRARSRWWIPTLTARSMRMTGSSTSRIPISSPLSIRPSGTVDWSSSWTGTPWSAVTRPTSISMTRMPAAPSRERTTA